MEHTASRKPRLPFWHASSKSQGMANKRKKVQPQQSEQTRRGERREKADQPRQRPNPGRGQVPEKNANYNPRQTP